MPENTTKQHFDQSFIVRIGFALLIVGFYFFGLTIPLLGPDEPRYAQVAREMYERGDWITPTLGGFNWFEKPVLLYWLEIASYKIFGLSEFSARFGPALFGLGTILCIWVLGRHIERRKVSNAGIADWFACIAASSIGIIVFSRGASFDIILTLPITAALVSFYRYETAENAGQYFSWSLVLFYGFIGIALLAKGLVGAMLPLGIVSFYYVSSWRLPSRTFIASLAWGLAFALMVSSIWYLPMYERHGWQFIDEFIIQHHFQRFTSNKYQHPQSFHFFFWVLPLMTIPWLPFFVGAVWKLIRGIFRRHVADDNSGLSKLDLFAASWTLVPVLFFSMSGSKLPGYVLPALPGALILSGSFAWTLSRRKLWLRHLVPAITIATFALLLFLLITKVPSFADADSVKSLISQADAQGFGTKPVLMFHTVSHNAEFYAAGRIQRDEKGAQRKIGSLDELVETVANGGGSAVVLMPAPYLEQIKTEKRLEYQLIADNGEVMEIAVWTRSS